jgi:neutral amino acid transport system permease protein
VHDRQRRHKRLPIIIGALALGLLAVSVPQSASADPVHARSTFVAADSTCSPDDSTGCVRGTLRDAGGNPVTKVKVSLTDPDGKTTSVTSSATGSWVFTVKVEGSYSVAVDTSTLPKTVTLDEPKKTIDVGFSRLSAVAFSFTGSQVKQVAADPVQEKLMTIWQQFASGLRLGLLLALASIGLSLVYGTTGMSNFAHAEQVTLGGFLGFVFANVLGLNIVLATVITVILCAFTGYAQDRLLWAPLRRRGLGLSQLMVVTIGLSLALEYLFQYIFGGGTVSISSEIQKNGGPLLMTKDSYISMGIALVVLLAVGYFLLRTRTGRATRAVSDNRALAAASGIDVDKIIRLVWTISAGLAGLGGVLYTLVNHGVKWDTGLQILLLMFAAVTLGGLGTAFGALVGSMIIGVVVELSNLVLSSDLKYGTALVILIVILMFRPQGILGRRERVG